MKALVKTYKVSSGPLYIIQRTLTSSLKTNMVLGNHSIEISGHLIAQDSS